MDDLYLEDFEPGQVYPSKESHLVDAQSIKAFAAAFDPQPFHMDEEAAKDSFFHGLAASGWMTAAVTMKLQVGGTLRPAGGVIGAGIDELRWLRPVRPGDMLRTETEILAKRASHSRPMQGVIKVKTTTFNQNDEVVQTCTGSLMVQRRAS